jgi:uncharacterized protein (TIGR00251 family)
LAEPFTKTRDGLRLAVRVTPRASRESIGTTAADADGNLFLKVMVTAAPEGGKANAAVVRLLAKTWKIPKSAIEVVSGASDRRKVLRIAGDGEELAGRIRDWMKR